MNGAQVAQVLRVSLDGGSQLNHFQTFYRRQSGREPLAVAVGLKKVKDGQKEFNAERGRLTIWEPMSNDLGMQGLAILVNPAGVEVTEDKLNHLVVLKPASTVPVSDWAGFVWDRAGRITSAEAWRKYVDEFAEARRSPIAITVK
ncbi:MAG TPA: DUF4861 family protein [Pyrinomonadaceae bacterium]